MKRGSCLSFACSVLWLSQFLSVQALKAEPTQNEIIVQALKNGYRLDAKRLQQAQHAFVQHRGFAPLALLRFRVADRSGKKAPLRLWLRSGETQIEVPIHAGGVVDLPSEAFATGAVLYANRASKALRIQPEIASPGTSDLARRLGDLRLQCRVMWAMVKDDVPFPIRVLFGGAGEICVTRKVPVYFDAPIPLRNVTVEAGGRSRQISISSANSYHPPIEDKTLPDSATVRLE